MAAPTLQAEAAAWTVVTGSDLPPPIPAHVANDILFATVAAWVPVTAAAAVDIPTPAGWNKLAEVDLASGDGGIAWYWRRAAGAGETVTFLRGAGWDSGTDTMYGGRVDVIRGCETSGNPFDAFAASAAFTTANQNTPAITVSGAERLVMVFEAHTVDSASAQFTALTGFTMNTHRGSATGTGGGGRPASIASTGSSVGATASTHLAPAAGRHYAFGGISFKPPAAATLTRSASFDAVAAVSVAAVGFSVLERSTSFDATAAISTTPQRTLQRSAALAASAAVEADVERTLQRAIAIAAQAGIETTPQRELLRAASIDAVAALQVADFERDHIRAAAFDVLADVEISDFERDHVRAVLLAAVADVEVSALVDSPQPETFERSASFDATAAIETAPQRTLERSVAIAAQAAISTTPQRELERSASFAMIAVVSAAGAIAALRWRLLDEDDWQPEGGERWPPTSSVRWPL